MRADAQVCLTFSIPNSSHHQDEIERRYNTFAL